MKFKHLALASSIALLAACGDDSSNVTQLDVRPADVINAPNLSRIQFSPADGIIAVPNDLLFLGTTDGTLEMPDEVDAKEAGEMPNFADPAVALGALDGWSTQMPLRIGIDTIDGVTFDASSISPTSVYMVEALMGGDDGCEQIPRGAACAPVAALTYGVDYFVTSTGNDIVVVPLRPLKPATTYLVGVSSDLSDSAGNAIAPAPLYGEIARDDITINEPDTLGPLQGIINSYEAVISAQVGRPQSDLIYSSAWTTQSVGVDLTATLAVAGQVGVSVSNITNTGATVEQVLIGQGVLAPEVAGLTPFAAAQLHTAEITLPYYLATPSTDNPTAPLTTSWTAACDSGVVLLDADLTGLTPGDNQTLCSSVGLADFGVDTERHITQYNPIPQMRSMQTIPVQITTPVGAAGASPVVILQHGITSRKEDMLAVTGAFAQAGIATIAIDHPLHGERGFDLDADGTDDINASDVSVLNYMNLENLLVGRDNLKQSVADMLALRLAIASDPATGGALAAAGIDTSNVHFSGMSLGGITGVSFVSLANANGLNVQRASFVVPGGGIGPLLIESANFGSLVQGSVVLGAGTELSGQLAAFLQAPVTGCEGITDASTLLGCAFPVFRDGLTDPAALAEIQTNVASFALASQTVLDSADPNNLAAGVVAAMTPTYIAEVIGDTVIPNQTQAYPIGGTEPLARFLGLSQVDATTAGATSGLVKFTAGSHGTLLSPEASAEATTEMQTQTITFHAAGVVMVNDGSVVQQTPTQM